MSRLAIATLLAASLASQDPGTRIFQSIGNHPTRLIDINNNVIHTWPGSGGANLVAHIGPEGYMWRGVRTGTSLMAGGETGRVQKVAFDGTVVWDYTLDTATQLLHHDVIPMPSGTVMVMVWNRMTDTDAFAAGRDPALLTGSAWLPESILELQPVGSNGANVVWEWHMMDHIVQDFDSSKPNYGVVANSPELLDINFPAITIPEGDWNHFNGMDYDPINDLIIISSREQSELYIIDHSTTTAEAAGHTGGNFGKGGDFLWRWGNPQAYDAGGPLDQQLFYQHDPRFIPLGYPGAGNVTVFNNDYLAGPSPQSAVHEIVLPKSPGGAFIQTLPFGPNAPIWTFTAPSLYSQFISGCQRLPNGNTLICSGLQSGLLEVTPANTVVWNYTEPSGVPIFQASYVDRTLWQDSNTMSIAGDVVGFNHVLGSNYSTYFRLLIGSASGNSPGTLIPGLSGPVLVPLNFDFLTSAMALQFNQGIFVDTYRILDPSGEGISAIVVPGGFIPPGLIGTELDFAQVIFSPVGTGILPVRSGNSVRVTIVP